MHFYRFILLWMMALPVGLWAQADGAAAANHAQALQQFQQQHPQAQPIDLAAEKAAQADAHGACSSCPKQLRPSPAVASSGSTATREQLLAEQQRLAEHIQALRQAEPMDRALLQKYARALEQNFKQLNELDQLDRKTAHQQARQ